MRIGETLYSPYLRCQGNLRWTVALSVFSIAGEYVARMLSWVPWQVVAKVVGAVGKVVEVVERSSGSS